MDIDIDLTTDFRPEKIFKNIVKASMVENGELKQHLVGVYFQNIPQDSFTKLSAIPYKVAESYGFMKIDMLHLNLLSHFKSKREVLAVLRKPPNWKLLKDKDFVSKLFHLSKHYDIIQRIKPTCIMDIADTLAIIRPGKTVLIDKYLVNKNACRKELYNKVHDSDLRKAHAVAYAHNVVIHMNLLEAGIE